MKIRIVIECDVNTENAHFINADAWEGNESDTLGVTLENHLEAYNPKVVEVKPC